MRTSPRRLASPRGGVRKSSTMPMPESSLKLASSKARILAGTAVDIAIDLLLPTVVYVLLSPTRLSAVVRLTIGGYFVAAKAAAGHLSRDDEIAQHKGFFQTFLFGAVIAVVATAVTLGDRFAGYSDTTAIVAGTVLIALVQGISMMRSHRKLDGFALLVLLELAATIILTSISNTPRMLLVRPSFYTAIAGFYVFSTVWSERPFMMQVTKPMATDGDPIRAEAFERAGRESVRFRRAEQSMTASLGIVLFSEALLRVWTVFSHPTSNVIVSSMRSQALGIGLFIAWFVAVKLVFVPIASHEVDSFMPMG
jgi:hypothetical protein